MFEAQAARAANAIALRHGNSELTYGHLAAQVMRAAAGLLRAGVRRGDRVGVLLPRSPELVITLLAIWRAGAAYVPLDPLHPHARARFVLADAGVTVLVSVPALADALGEVAARVTTPAELLAGDGDAPPAQNEPSDPAYILYTSGTTGDPRGVLVSHRALASYVEWAARRYDGAASFALYSSLAFDLTLTSLFVPLAAGGQVHVFAGDSPVEALFAAADDPRVEVLKLTPSHLALLVARGGAGGLRRLIVGGEALPTRLARAAQQRLGAHLEIVNEYGPTEATIGCVVHSFDPAHDTRDDVPIGLPAANATVQLLDPDLQPVQGDAVGEIHIAGPCLADGYVGDPEATRRAFRERDGVTIYRTGDLARRLPDGALEFVGRGDGQIKFAGHRVELDGLRALLLRHPAVREAAVLLRGDPRGRAALVAYYTVGQPVAASELRAHLTNHVSQEIVPGHFVELDALPLTASGKLDSRALPELDELLARAGSDVRPRTPTEEKLAEIWAQALGIAQVGPDDDFFELGGHSLLGNLIILSAREAFGIDLNMRSLFEQRTVAALARHIDGLRERPPEDVPAREPGLPQGALDLAGPAPPPGRTTDEENLARGGSIAGVDEMVGSFYSRYPWPWNSTRFDTLEDPEFEREMLSQEFGDYTHSALPPEASIWVAGCGTNQALLTALRFPRARVLGTDLSTRSLEICRETAAEFGVTNLELRLESINDADYHEQFDHVICTGVIHHTYEPAHALARLQRALRPGGVLELLVYNRFHRTITSAFQKAVGIMTRGLSSVDIAVARRIVAGFALDNTMSRFISRHRDWEESDFADLLINPHEHSYTVDSLAAMADGCGLELVRPCISLYAKYRADNIFWEMKFSDPEVQRVYDDLPDLDRWRVSNLLMHEKSPMLWFYMQRKDSPRPRQGERALAQAFLATRFVRAQTRQRSHIRGADGRFRPAAQATAFPGGAPEASLRPLVERCDGTRTMAEIFAELGRSTDFASVQQARLMLTIPAFPYLRAIAR